MRLKKLDFLLPLLAVICLAGTANAQPNMTDTVAYSALSTKGRSAHITKEVNVVFPAILTGNEAPAMEYVENFSNKRRDYLIRTYNRGKRFFAKAAAILKKYHLPQELKVLLALESGFNGNAVSGAGAVGYWQFMDETAREYGLRIVPQPTKEEKAQMAKAKLPADSLAKLKKQLAKEQAKDERRNFGRSTHAAARYLRDRSRNLHNDWLLVVASYNCGIGNVWEAMAKSGKARPTYWDIKDNLPAETRGYVQNFVALNVVYNNYDKFMAGQLVFKPVMAEGDRFEQTMSEALASPSLK
jgi:membrane-bound lytic murein transglycosylase MltF